jgi:thiamine-monophosphate kinase
MARFSQGLGAAQKAFGMHLAGGDTDRTPGHFSIAMTVIGEVPAGKMVRRAAAQAGDALYVSGSLGDSALGLALKLDAGSATRLGLSVDETAHALGRYLRPQPRVALAEALRAHARAATDLSDGLMKDLGRMCRASGVGARVTAGDLPLSPAMRRAINAEAARIKDAVAAGDDYEILAAVPPAASAGFEAAARRSGIAVTRIGKITSEREVFVLDAQGAPIEPGRSGWDHFQPR